MAKKETKLEGSIPTMEPREINLDDFFTKERQENGVWFEPDVNGNGIGFEVLTIGSESDEAASIFAEYEKDLNRIKQIDNAAKSNEETRRAMAKVAAKLVKDMRGIDGAIIKVCGNEIGYSEKNMQDIFYNMPSLAMSVVRFARNDTNFMKK